MSIRYVAAVLDELPSLTARDTLILVALADFASDETRECWPSLKLLCKRARCDRRTVQRRLRSLEQRGYLEIATGGHQYGKNTANRYRLKFGYAGELLTDVEPTLSPRAAECRPTPPKIIPKGGSRAGKGGTPPAPRAAKLAAPSVIRTVIEPKSVKDALKTKTVDNSMPDRVEQLERLRRLDA